MMHHTMCTPISKSYIRPWSLVYDLEFERHVPLFLLRGRNQQLKWHYKWKGELEDPSKPSKPLDLWENRVPWASKQHIPNHLTIFRYQVIQSKDSFTPGPATGSLWHKPGAGLAFLPLKATAIYLICYHTPEIQVLLRILPISLQRLDHPKWSGRQVRDEYAVVVTGIKRGFTICIRSSNWPSQPCSISIWSFH